MELEKLASIFDSVKVATIGPNDVLVFRTAEKLPDEAKFQIHAILVEHTGCKQLLVLDNGADLALLRTQQPEEEAAPEAFDPMAAYRARRLGG